MMFVNIAVLSETEPLEKRFAMVPAVAARLQKLGGRLHMLTGGGAAIDLADTAFPDVVFCPDAKKLVAEATKTLVAEATKTLVAEANKTLVAQADVVLAVQAPAPAIIAAMPPGAILICYLDAASQPDQVAALLAQKITCFAMQNIPRISRAQAMDALSSQAALAGYLSVMQGASLLKRVLPKITSAAGAIGPAKVLVMGLGVAGLEAVATAHRLGAVVEGYDVRPETAEQVASLGANFVATGVNATGKGGYARALTAAETATVTAALTKHIQAADLIITTAAIPGRPSPRLISKAQVAGMKAGAVIVDIAAEGGGNCEASLPGETVRVGRVTIAAPLNVPSLLSEDASTLYAKNLGNLLALMLKDNIITIDWTDEVIAGTALTHDGKRMHVAASAA
jgi:NAD(P) transhydrogenase subunit alpha